MEALIGQSNQPLPHNFRLAFPVQQGNTFSALSRRLMDLYALPNDTFLERPRAVTLAANFRRHQSQLVVPFLSTLANLKVNALSRILAGNDTVTRRPDPGFGVVGWAGVGGEQER